MKNMDPLNDNIATLLHQSSDKFVSELWKDGTLFALCPLPPVAAAGLFPPLQWLSCRIEACPHLTQARWFPSAVAPLRVVSSSHEAEAALERP